MSNLSDLPPVLAGYAQMMQGQVQGVSDAGWIDVRLSGLEMTVACRVLCAPGSTSALARGDEVLVWLSGEETGGSVVLGRIGLQSDAVAPVVPAAEFAKRPKSVVIESQGDLVLRNGQARIKLSAEGDIEIVCASFVTRSQRLLRLLAPFIRLN
jgi:hypothetical protein